METHRMAPPRPMIYLRFGGMSAMSDFGLFMKIKLNKKVVSYSNNGVPLLHLTEVLKFLHAVTH